jgi:uncharacterized protein with HEPN domain
MQSDRNTDILRHIINYCSDISEAIQRFGEDYAVFSHDSVYKNATALCVLQIGELTTHLTDDFKQTYTEIPWVQIKALRNIVAHNYGKIDDESLWETITGDIPTLKDYCVKIMQQQDLDEIIEEDEEKQDFTME